MLQRCYRWEVWVLGGKGSESGKAWRKKRRESGWPVGRALGILDILFITTSP